MNPFASLAVLIRVGMVLFYLADCYESSQLLSIHGLDVRGPLKAVTVPFSRLCWWCRLVSPLVYLGCCQSENKKTIRLNS